MDLKFDFKKEQSPIFGIIYRPMAKVLFWSKKDNYWVSIRMVIDTGADYTLLPRFMAEKLGVNVEKECQIFHTRGIGGTGKVYFLSQIKVKLGNWTRTIPVGFLDKDNIPPLLGRQKFLETFDTEFLKKHIVVFKG